ncbi:hypothetical protein ACHWQZ_G014159 [Mnemiopsis leidyi]
MHPQPTVWGHHPNSHQQNPNITRHGNHLLTAEHANHKDTNPHLISTLFDQRRYYQATVSNRHSYRTYPDNFEVLLTPISTPPPIPRSIPSVKKKLLFIRHAEAYHNSLYKNGLKNNALLVRDPQLTPNGHNQVQNLRNEVNNIVERGYQPEIILVSPLTRTLQTATGGFFDQAVKLEACSLITELCDAKCNEGQPVSQLRRIWHYVNFLQTPEIWWPEYESQEELYNRVSTFKKWIAYRPEQNIAIVSHGGFLYALLRQYFANCETRLMEWNINQQ